MVRAPNHLGEAVLALPALEAAAARERENGRPRPLVQIVEGLLPLLRLAGLDAEPLPLRDRRAVVRAARELRARRAGRGVLLTPSASAALILLLAGVRSRRGVAAPGRSWMLTERVERAPLLAAHRTLEFLALIAPGETPSEPPAPRLRATDAARAAWRSLTARLGAPGWAGPTVGLVPGARARSRRWPAERFAALAGRLAAGGRRVLVFGGAEERERTATVAAGAAAGPGPALDLGGRTGVEELAGGLAACDVVVSNDTGPMHLAAAVGAAIVALEGPADVRQTRPLAPRVRLVGRFDLPCVPCVANECPRRGRGYVLAEAERECLRLVAVEEVHEAAESLLEGSG